MDYSNLSQITNELQTGKVGKSEAKKVSDSTLKVKVKDANDVTVDVNNLISAAKGWLKDESELAWAEDREYEDRAADFYNEWSLKTSKGTYIVASSADDGIFGATVKLDGEEIYDDSGNTDSYLRKAIDAIYCSLTGEELDLCTFADDNISDSAKPDSKILKAREAQQARKVKDAKNKIKDDINDYDLFQKAREILGDDQIITELLAYWADDQLSDFLDHLTQHFDLDAAMRGEDIVDSAKPERKQVEYKTKMKDSMKPFSGHLRALRVSDSYKSLYKRIKDELDETTSTDEVIEVVSNFMEEGPVEEVVPAAIDIIAEAVDTLQSKLDAQQELNGSEEPTEESTEEPAEEPTEESTEKPADSVSRARVIAEKLRNSRK